jgi:tRNA (guanine-N(7)-)-methyltransferase subunit TRM82
MPKRPCAVALTADDSTIISADKFGDVYSLPLLIPEGPDSEPLKPAKATPEPISAKPFVPAASTLTVHSQRNRKALENQKKQGGRPADKSEPNFEHKLLLGHVSMLTDLALVSLEGRDYILTADRDEHIRVSRGIPQTHVIEGFCLGHTEFISRLCIPRNRPEILISGGGDDELFVWEWLKGVLLSKAGLRVLAMGIMNEISGAGMEDGSNKTPKFAVSGIKNLSRLGNDGAEELVLVACEGYVQSRGLLLYTPLSN